MSQRDRGGTTSADLDLPYALRQAAPENRIRVYDTKPIIDLLADMGSVIPLKKGYGEGIHTALGRII